MKLTDISVNRSVTSIMLFLALILLGFVSYSKMPFDLLPDIEYPNVGPEEIESTVTRRLEETLAGINNVDEITSTLRE